MATVKLASDPKTHTHTHTNALRDAENLPKLSLSLQIRFVFHCLRLSDLDTLHVSTDWARGSLNLFDLSGFRNLGHVVLWSAVGQ